MNIITIIPHIWGIAAAAMLGFAVAGFLIGCLMELVTGYWQLWSSVIYSGAMLGGLLAGLVLALTIAGTAVLLVLGSVGVTA